MSKLVGPNAVGSASSGEETSPTLVSKDVTPKNMSAFVETDDCLPPPPIPAPAIALEIAAKVLEQYSSPIDVAETPVVAGYEILSRLGRGGMGVVYKARQLRLNRIVALKVILAGAQAEPKELDRFRTEAQAVARLQHPNIVQIIEAGEHNGCPYFALEFVPGGNLAEMLAGKPQPARLAAQLTETLARAIDFAHKHGIVHRDLKPANVLLQKRSEVRDQRSETRDQSVGTAVDWEAVPADPCPLLSDLFPKITDFGLAKRLECPSSQTKTGELMGTPSYMAPEQADGNGNDIGPAVDIYALGAMLYEMLTGRPPFLGVNALETLRQVRHEDPVAPMRLQPKVPRDLDTICLKCLQKEPEKRYADAARLADDLRRFLDREPIEARPVRFWERGWKWARRQPAKAMLLLVSTMATLLIGAGGWWSFAKVSNLAAELAWQVERADQKAQEAGKQRTLAELGQHEALEQRQLAERREKEANAQRRLADTNLRNLGEVVDHFIAFSERLSQARLRRLQNGEDPDNLTEQGNEQSQREQNLAQLSSEMKQAAREFYEKFAEQRSDDPEMRAEQGRALRRIARITNQTGDKREAIKKCEQAVGIFDDLARENPEQPAYLHELAFTLCEQATALIDVDRNQAIAPLRRALSIQEKLRQDYPADINYGKELAGTYLSLGSLLNDTFQFDQAKPLLDRALETRQNLLDEDPTNETNRRAVAATQMVLGRFYRYQSGPVQLDQAETLYRKALETRKALQLAHPKDLGMQTELADSHYWLGGLCYLKGGLGQAEEHFCAALAIQEKLRAANVEHTAHSVALGRTVTFLGSIECDRGNLELSLEHYARAIQLHESAVEKGHIRAKRFLAVTKIERAETMTRLGMQAEAQEEWRQAFDLSSFSCWNNQLDRAETLARRGEHILARAKADAMAQESSINRDRRFTLAGVYALTTAAAQKDEQLESAQRDKVAKETGASAIALLDKNRSQGYFKSTPAKIDQLKTDPTFDSIRSRPDFQKLLKRLAD